LISVISLKPVSQSSCELPKENSIINWFTKIAHAYGANELHPSEFIPGINSDTF
jgi:hypothetical protein